MVKLVPFYALTACCAVLPVLRTVSPFPAPAPPDLPRRTAPPAVRTGAAPEAAGAQAPEGPQLAMGPRGLTSLRFGGRELLHDGELRVNQAVLRRWDGTSHPADLKEGRFTADPARQEVTRSYPWGSVSCRYTVRDNRLNLDLQVTNRSEEVLSGIFLEPLQLSFPEPPRGWDGNPRLAHNIGSPSVIRAEYGRGTVALVNEDVGRPLLCGFPWPLDRPASRTYPLWIYTSRHASLPDSLPYIDRPIYPGGADQFHLSFRFGPAGAAEATLASDLYRRFADAYPFRLHWTDRRPIGELFLSSSDLHAPTNPRGWLNDRTVDVTTPAGLAAFHRRVLEYADTSVRILKEMNAQGMVLWDPEGQEYPHATSYLGDPRSLPAEIEPVIDAFFQRFRTAGLRTGICVRPQRPVRGAYSPEVVQQEVPDPAANLIAKITLAKRRWGCTLFYVDSNGDPGQPMDAAIFQRVAAAHPDVLLMPEHQNVRYYAYTAPYDELRGGVTSTPAEVRDVYPGAFTAIAVADGPIDARRAELVQAVRRGDLLLFRGWFDDSYNRKVREIYSAARNAPAP